MSSSDRKEYESATTLDQSFLNNSQDNLTNKLDMIVDIETPTGTIYASNTNQYVGSTFYEALIVLPTIGRTLGEWLSSELEFSTLQLEISNVDGRFNEFLPEGANFGGWIGKDVEVKIGLRDVSATYFTVFNGKVTEIGGLERSVKSITVIARDQFDKLAVAFPTEVFGSTEYPKIQDTIEGLGKPIIYGDWTEPSTLTNRTASVPAFLVNGADPFIQIDEEETVDISIASPGVITLTNHNYDADDPVEFSTTGALPTGIVTATLYYAQPVDADTFTISAAPAGANINTSGTQSGEHAAIPSTLTYENLKFVISKTVLKEFDTTRVYLFRGDIRYLIDSADIVNVAGDKNAFEIVQDSGSTLIGTDNFIFQDSDQYYVRVKGKDLSGYDDNIVEQGRDILKDFGGVVAGDFDSSWDTFRDKASPVVSAISTFKSRVWIQEAIPAIEYVLSMLEQVRLEAFVDRNQKLKMNSLHFDEWVASPTHTVGNWDVGKGSFSPKIDTRNNFNRAHANYNFLPDHDKNANFSPFFRNEAAITQAGKEISKQIIFPNLYEPTVVNNQMRETLKLASAFYETLDMTLTWRSLLKDLGDFVNVNVEIGSSEFTDVPAMIRSVDYDPDGFKIPVKLWSFQLVPFDGHSPSHAGIVGGSTATIVEE